MTVAGLAASRQSHRRDWVNHRSDGVRHVKSPERDSPTEHQHPSELATQHRLQDTLEARLWWHSVERFALCSGHEPLVDAAVA